MVEISLRPVVPDDLEFLWRVQTTALKPYIEKTWGWNEHVQREFVSEMLKPPTAHIILVDGVEAGYWNVIDNDHDVFLSSILLIPAFQSQGIGTRLITDLIRNSQKPVRLQVLKVNPARRLYEKLGFEMCGETETHIEMIRNLP